MIVPRRREPNGQLQRASRPESRESIMRIVTSQPHRRSSRAPESPLLGFALGREFLHGPDHGGDTGIDRDQFTAGQRYARLSARYARLVTGTMPKLPAPMFEAVGGGISCIPDPDEEDVIALRREHADMHSALRDARDYTETNRILWQVCVWDRPPNGWAERGYLRQGLNVLHNLWR